MTSRVVAIGPPKEAALYFDEVLPLDISTSVLSLGPELANAGFQELINLSLPFDTDEQLEKILSSLMPRNDGVHEFYAAQLIKTVWHPITLFLTPILSDEERREAFLDHNDIEIFRRIYSASGIDFDEICKQITTEKFSWDPYMENLGCELRPSCRRNGICRS